MQRGLATRKLSISLSVRLSIRLSVCLSVKLVDYDKIKESSAQIFIPHERSFVPVFWEEEWLVGGDPFDLKFWVKLTPLYQNFQFSVNICS